MLTVLLDGCFAALHFEAITSEERSGIPGHASEVASIRPCFWSARRRLLFINANVIAAIIKTTRLKAFVMENI